MTGYGDAAESYAESCRRAIIADQAQGLTVTGAAGLPEPQLGRQLRPPTYVYRARPPGLPYLPVQGVVDRSQPLPEMTVDTYLPPKPGLPGRILRYSWKNAKRGRLHPDDPSAFSLRMPFGEAICPTLAPYAAARCLRTW